MAEKITFTNSRGLKLVGILEPVNTNKIVIMAHGFTSNKDRPKFVKIANELNKAGFATLRFDFGGSGESDFADITVKNQVDDLNSAIRYAKSKGYAKIGLLGSSLGGLDCILAYDKDIKTIVLLAPVTKAKTPSEFSDPKVRAEVEQKGHIIITKDNKDFRIPKQYIQERESIKQDELLSKIKCPVLIIHGDQDEHVPVNYSKEAMRFLPSESRLEIMKGWKHRLEEDLDKLAPMVVSWFNEHM